MTTPFLHEDMQHIQFGGVVFDIFVHIDFFYSSTADKKWIIWFEDISQTTNCIFMKFVQEMHSNMLNNRGKFQLNQVYGFRENDYHHLQPIRIFLEIRDVGSYNFWWGDAL